MTGICLRAQVGPDGRISDSRWCLGGLDAVPIEAVLPPGAALLPTTARDWQVGQPALATCRHFIRRCRDARGMIASCLAATGSLVNGCRNTDECHFQS